MIPIVTCASKFPITVSVMLLMAVISLIGFANQKFYYRFILHPYSLFRQKEYDRLVISDFLHNNKLHLLINEGLLYVFGSDLEEHLKRITHHGSLRFFVIYMSSLLLGTAVTAFRHLDEFDYASCGASGSIMGLMFSFMMLAPQNESLYLPFLGDVKNTYSVLIYILVMIFLRNRNHNSMINLEQHFFGATGGVIATLMLFPGIYSKIILG